MLLDITAEFDMVDYNVLIDRLLFGLFTMTLNWFSPTFKKETVLYQLVAAHQKS